MYFLVEVTIVPWYINIFRSKLFFGIWTLLIKTTFYSILEIFPTPRLLSVVSKNNNQLFFGVAKDYVMCHV